MNISGLQYNLNRKTLEIYVSGCYGKCYNCHNIDLWDFSYGSDFRIWRSKIFKRIETGLVNDIWILGGDPLDQPESDLIELIDCIKENYPEVKIWIWTRYQLDQINDCILNRVNYIKTGEYINDDVSYVDKNTGIRLASSNQKIIFIKN